jgi:hypothetical protein
MKKARGQVKALAHSAKDMMEKHDWSDGQMFDARQGILRYYDDEGVWFEETYTIESEE